ncbi:uncharacterized protein LOC132901740 [Amyelois transitella]|uniref:uncharacterized protein LOC132902214 n=1 Tax=Amyelois transitella TaxID=680683 RepID=UPI00067E071F|nr:uncharacterized protein LOC132902214 [Amyelois transitella]XP_060806500.1 uncharacterized protein LOC132901740 [Amyelois transitella]
MEEETEVNTYIDTTDSQPTIISKSQELARDHKELENFSSDHACTSQCNCQITIKEHKETQTREAGITFTLRNDEGNSTQEIFYTTRNLPEINFHNRTINDPRNEDFARIVAFELERLPENMRTIAYSTIFNTIQSLKTEMAAEDLHPITSDNVNKHGDLSETQNKKNLKQRVLKNLKKMYGNLPP